MYEFLNNLIENWNVYNVSNLFNIYFLNVIFYIIYNLDLKLE